MSEYATFYNAVRKPHLPDNQTSLIISTPVGRGNAYPATDGKGVLRFEQFDERKTVGFARLDYLACTGVPVGRDHKQSNVPYNKLLIKIFAPNER